MSELRMRTHQINYKQAGGHNDQSDLAFLKRCFSFWCLRFAALFAVLEEASAAAVARRLTKARLRT